MTEPKNFHEDFERESLKDVIYLYEEQQAIMKEIVEDEHRKPAKIYIVKEPKLQENDQFDILPF
jgi:transcriptional regulator of heat shock response